MNVGYTVSHPFADLVGRVVRTGTGTLLGRVVRTATNRDGTIREIVVRQESVDKEWRVDTVHVDRVGEEIILKGPRAGFHIAPLSPTPWSDVVVGTADYGPAPPTRAAVAVDVTTQEKP